MGQVLSCLQARVDAGLTLSTVKKSDSPPSIDDDGPNSSSRWSSPYPSPENPYTTPEKLTNTGSHFGGELLFVSSKRTRVERLKAGLAIFSSVKAPVFSVQ